MPDREQWEIEVGNEAVVTELITIETTQRAAVRAANKRWLSRKENETILVLRRPGCRPFRLRHIDETV